MNDGKEWAHTWCTSTHTLGVIALFQQTMYTTDWELETGLGRTRLRLALSTGLATRLSGFAYGSQEIRTRPDRLASQSAHLFQTKRVPM